MSKLNIVLTSLFLLICVLWKWHPQWISSFFVFNLWFLSYPHTIVTFERSYFRLQRHKIFALIVYLFIFGLNYLIYRYYDLVVLMNLYFYLQFFHYIRQNFGIAKIGTGHNWKKLDSWLYHLVSFTALSSLWDHPINFLGYHVHGLIFHPDQRWIFIFSLIVLAIRLFYQALQKRFYDFNLYTHIALLSLTVYSSQFFILGWLGLHLYHNVQYLFLNWDLTRRNSFWLSYVKALAFVLVFYNLAMSLNMRLIYYLPFSFIVILSVNYSHYFFDTFLWKYKYRENYP